MARDRSTGRAQRAMARHARPPQQAVLEKAAENANAAATTFTVPGRSGSRSPRQPSPGGAAWQGEADSAPRLSGTDPLAPSDRFCAQNRVLLDDDCKQPACRVCMLCAHAVLRKYRYSEKKTTRATWPTHSLKGVTAICVRRRVAHRPRRAPQKSPRPLTVAWAASGRGLELSCC